MRIVAWFVLLGLAAGSQAGDAKKRPLTTEDLWRIQRVGKPTVAPNGKWAAVEVTKFSLDDNSSTSDIWLLATDDSQQKRLTTFTGKNSGPIFSPDGKQIAFTSKRVGDVPQIYLISPEGGEARQVSNLPMAPSALKWSADGKSIFCIVNTWPDTPDDESYKKKEKALKDNKVQAYIIDDALYRVWDSWIADGRRPVVFQVDVASGKHTNLFAHTKRCLLPQSSETSYDVSPDGKEICFASETTKEIGTDFNTDLYTMPIGRSEEPKNVTPDNLANDFSPSYSPNGKSLAYLRTAIKYFYADRARIMLRDLSTGETRELTAKLDRTCGSPRWMADNQRIYFEAEDAGYTNIFFVSTKGNDAKTFPEKGVSEHSMDAAKDIRMGVFLRSSFDLPNTVWVHQPGQKPRQISHFNDALVSQWQLGKVESVKFKGADNEDVQMWVVYPPNFDASKKWPLLQMVHGGPHNGIMSDFSYRWNLQNFAAQGYVVGCVNFHGSSGFGQKFTDSITGDMGTKPFTDVMKGTDWFEQQPWIDKNRMVAAGASYGGYMMAWINGHTDRFKAMVCHAGVYNWHSMMASDFVRSRERPLGAMPWGDLSKIDGQTPQRFAANFKTPTLVIHGEKDYRVPVTQGFEYYNTLRIKGVPTRLVYFPDENHWILKCQNSLLWHREFFAWMDRYVGTGPTK